MEAGSDKDGYRNGDGADAVRCAAADNEGAVPTGDGKSGMT